LQNYYRGQERNHGEAANEEQRGVRRYRGHSHANERGTIRRLRPFGRELYTFVCRYDDRSEARAAEEAAQATDYEAARQAVANLNSYANLASPTNAQTVAVVKLLCRVSVILIKRALGVG
jgi:hypothetical protein